MPESKNKSSVQHIKLAEAEALKEKLDKHFWRLLQAKQVKHALASVESMDGSFKWARAAGTSEPGDAAITVETPFWIASVTKLYTAAAVFRLYEQGRLTLEDALADHLPPGLIEGLHRTKDGTDHTNLITIRHLLGHSSGLPDYIEIKPEGQKSLFDRVLEKGDMSWSIEEIVEIVRDVKKPLFPPQPLDAAGIKVRYSDTNYQLLIAIIEKVTGRPVWEAFEEMIFRPLHLKETYHPAGKRPAGLPPAAPVYYGDRILDIPKAMSSFNDLYSTAADLTAYMKALIRGDAFETPETKELMAGSWNRFGFMISPVAPGWPIEYGLGMMRFRIPRLFSPFRAVPELIGHTGASGSWLFYCPPLDVILAGTVDQVGAGAVPFRFGSGLLSTIEQHAG